MITDELIEERLTRSIIGAFYAVYRTLGFGFLEHVYVMALERELRARGHQVAREETKSTYRLHPAAQRQLYNYLRATSLEVGLIHFGPEPRFYRLMYRNPYSPARDLKHVHLPPPE